MPIFKSRMNTDNSHLWLFHFSIEIVGIRDKSQMTRRISLPPRIIILIHLFCTQCLWQLAILVQLWGDKNNSREEIRFGRLFHKGEEMLSYEIAGNVIHSHIALETIDSSIGFSREMNGIDDENVELFEAGLESITELLNFCCRSEM